MEIVTGSTGEAHVTPVDDAVRNTNLGYYSDRAVLGCYRKDDNYTAFQAVATTANEIRIYGGYGINQGRIFKIDKSEYDSVTIENGSQGVKRADLIVAKYTRDSQTGFEDISLVVIKGQSGQTYTDPSFITGNMNEGATEDDFPLYRVKINGIVIEAVEPLFTPLPDGGRLGFVEKKIDDYYDALLSLISSSGNGDMLRAIYDPDEDGVIGVAQGGTGVHSLSSLKLALYGSSNYIPVASGGTGKRSVTSGCVLVGNGTDTMTERAIDSTSGGTQGSNALITSGAVNSKIKEMQTSFQAGVDKIYDAIVAQGVQPSASTPDACAEGINTVAINKYNSGKSAAENVTWTEQYQQITIDDSWMSCAIIPLKSAISVKFDGFTQTPATMNGLLLNVSTLNAANIDATPIRDFGNISGQAGKVLNNFTSTEKYLCIRMKKSQRPQFTVTRQAKILR